MLKPTTDGKTEKEAGRGTAGSKQKATDEAARQALRLFGYV
jgi:dsRNA-specific ribonuclease